MKIRQPLASLEIVTRDEGERRVLFWLWQINSQKKWGKGPITNAESRIRDVDMAAEMVNFTKDNILQQSAMAMLTQANQQPNQILSLLQG